jgi:dihydrofolate reductase
MSERKVIAHVAVSIDGFTSEPEGGMNWIFEHAVHEQTAAHFAGIWRGATTVLLGRTNYEGFHGVWPAVAKDPDIGWFPPSSAARQHDFAVWLDAVEKVVFSRTLTEPIWENSRITAREPADEVAELKGAPGRDILILSSVSIIRALLRAELVDELQLTVVPAVIGSGGLPLFDGDVPASKWQLASLATFPSGAVGLQYHPVREG